MTNRINSHKIANLCYYIDRICRSELNNGNITSERDYVSSLGTHLRFPLGPFSFTRIATARTLHQNLETTFGCDSIIIFKKSNSVKIGLFEAKWPRFFLNRNYTWDSKNASGESRFSSQLSRQNNWSNSGAYIWEMFFNESPPGQVNPPFDKYGSNCLPHQAAHNYFLARKTPKTIIWNNRDFLNMLPNSMNFKEIVYYILICNFGEKFKINNDNFTITSNDKEIELLVPIVSKLNLDIKKNETLNIFMKKTGLSQYICIDIDEFEKLI